jgi:DNA-binding NarL/FixJ family response regulator
MQIALIHGQRPAREVLQRALASKLSEDVTEFGSVEDLLLSSMQYDVLVVYNALGHHLNGTQGVSEIRKRLPDAFIVGVSNKPNVDHIFLSAGADAFLLRSGNEIQELADLIRKTGGQKLAQ